MHKKIYFATSNKHKFNEAKRILSNWGIKIIHYHFEHNEIRSDNIEEIANEAALFAYKKLKKPVFVEDTGLFIKKLNDFPGTYSGWVQKKIGNSGILALLEKEKRRQAEFRASIVFIDKGYAMTFTGVCKGSISHKIKGKTGFGYDSVFIPRGYRITFGQSKGLKNKLSHRYIALQELATYIKS